MKKKLSKKHIICLCVIFVICVIAIGEAFYLLLFSDRYPSNNEVKNQVVDQNNQSENKDVRFSQLFQNGLIENEAIENINKKDQDKDLIYTVYEKVEVQEGKYDIEVAIPRINLNQEQIEEANLDIKQIFQDKAEAILKNTNNIGVIYSVKYQGFLNQNILSLVIQSTLKEGGQPQRAIVQTYNYNLETNQFIGADELIKKKDLEEKEVTKAIENEITRQNAQAQALKDLGYNVFVTDLDTDMYDYDQINNFFMDDQNNIYIIYAYGNSNMTSEMDLIIL